MKKRQIKKNEKKAMLKEMPDQTQLTTEQKLERAVQDVYTDCYLRSQSDKEKAFILSQMQAAMYGIKAINPDYAIELKNQLSKGPIQIALDLAHKGEQARHERRTNNLFRYLLIVAALSSSVLSAYQEDTNMQRNFQALTGTLVAGAYYFHSKYRKYPSYPPIPTIQTR